MSTARESPFTVDEVLQIGILSEVLSRLVFRHADVRRLCRAAIEVAEALQVEFPENGGLVDLVLGHDEPLLPIRYFEKPFDLVDEVPPAPPLTAEERAIEAEYFHHEPNAIDHYREAVRVRASALFDMLQNGQIAARGHTADGHLVPIAQSIWSHPDYYIHPPTGDIYEAGYESMVKKWTGVVLVLTDRLFHVKPLADDGLRSATPASDPRPKTKAVLSVEAKKKKYQACVEWLVAMMRASPNEPTNVKDRLQQQAQKKWRGLSERAFIQGWDEAVRTSGANAWSAPGARKKSPRRQSPR